MIFQGSRYQHARVEPVNGVPTIVSRRRPWRQVRPDDIYYTVRHHGEMLDELAHRLYGSGELWWVIADANGIADPLEPLRAGVVLRCPSPETVFGEVLA